MMERKSRIVRARMPRGQALIPAGPIFRIAERRSVRGRMGYSATKAVFIKRLTGYGARHSPVNAAF